MADVTITPSAVVKSSTTTQLPSNVTWGEAVDAGEWVYLDSATATYKLADNTTAIKANVAGMALTSGATGQPGVVAKGNPVTLENMTTGKVYYLSANPGKMCPEADLGSGAYVTALGGATSATGFIISLLATGVAVP